MEIGVIHGQGLIQVACEAGDRALIPRQCQSDPDKHHHNTLYCRERFRAEECLEPQALQDLRCRLHLMLPKDGGLVENHGAVDDE